MLDKKWLNPEHLAKTHVTRTAIPLLLMFPVLLYLVYRAWPGLGEHDYFIVVSIVVAFGILITIVLVRALVIWQGIKDLQADRTK
ncbi:MAG: hypothetical protein AABY18_08710 [Candidatus Thermoplasmatota archaeon]